MADKYVQIPLALVGGYSWRSSQSRKAIRITTFFHGFVTIALLVQSLLALLFAWNEHEKFSPASSMKISQCIWYLTQSVGAFTLLVSCQKSNRLPLYYYLKNKMEEKLKVSGVTIQRPSIKAKIATTVAAAYVLGNCCYMASAELTVNRVNIIFGESLDNRTTIFGTGNHTGIKYYDYFWNKFATGINGFIISYLLISCEGITSLFASFNKEVRGTLKSEKYDLEKLEKHRELYTGLSQLISILDQCLSFVIAEVIFGNLLIVIILLYALAGQTNCQMAPGDVFAFIYWLGSSSAFALILVVGCDRLQTKAGDICDDLFTLHFPYDVNTSDNRAEVKRELSLFINQVSRPSGMTLAHLFNITREFGITMASIIISFFFLMYQMNSSEC